MHFLLPSFLTSYLFFKQHQITPLHVASKWGKGNMVSLLIDKGANYEAKTRDGLTPLHCAARSGHDTVVDMLLEKGAPITSKTKVSIVQITQIKKREFSAYTPKSLQDFSFCNMSHCMMHKKKKLNIQYPTVK